MSGEKLYAEYKCLRPKKVALDFGVANPVNLSHALQETGSVPSVMGEQGLLNDLFGAVDRGEIVAHYQPQVDLATGRIVAAEALARWSHPDLGIIPPSVFIPLAEETALIHDIGRHMIEQVLTAATGWRTAGIPLEVSVNVSANQLTTDEFFDFLEADLRASELSPNAVTIEITETYPISEKPSIARRLADLRDQGLGISIDDYGIGHSWLDQLDRLPATELKLDQSLVQDESIESLSLMTAIIQLAHWRGLRVVAEGVETPEQLTRVKTLECDRAQGYLLGRPMPQREFEALLV